MSTTIYTSEKVMPYVYIGTHKATGQFYIGSRANMKQKLPSHLDLGTHYFTSSKYVKELGFENFNWVILAEFFGRIDAYKFEQKLIKEHWDNNLKINRHYDENGNNFSSRPGQQLSEEHKKNLRKPKSNKENYKGPISDEHKQNLRKPRKNTENMKGPKSEAHRQAMKGPRKNQRIKIPLQCPHCLKIGYGNTMYLWHFDKCKFID